MSLVRARQTHTRRLRQTAREESDFYPFGGGLNLIDSPLSSTPGEVQNALNYEMGFEGGYKRAGGYEKFNGLPSEASPDYWKLPFKATRRPQWWVPAGQPSGNENQGIVGLSSGAEGLVLDVQDEGGYGINRVLKNAEYANETYWDRDPLAVGTDSLSLVIDGDWKWENGDIPALSRLTDSGAGGDREHMIRTLNEPLSTGVGDVIYMSCYALYKQGSLGVKDVNARAGVRLQFTDTATGMIEGPATAPFVDFSIRRGHVLSHSEHFFDAGVEIVPGTDVLKLWAYTNMVEVADSAFNIEIMLIKETGPGNNTVTYTGGGKYVHVGGLSVVNLPSYGPMNQVSGRIFADVTKWNTTNITIADGGWVWPNTVPTRTFGWHSDLTRFTEPASSSGSPNTRPWDLNQDAGLAISVNKGDTIKCTFFAHFTAANREGIAFQILTINTAQPWFDDGIRTIEAFFNISQGIIPSTNTAYHIKTQRITKVDTVNDVYFCEIESTPLARGGRSDFFLKMAEEDGGDSELINTSYTFASLFWDIGGLRVWAGTDSLGGAVLTPDGTDTGAAQGYTTFAVAQTDLVEEVVPTGHLVLAGASIGKFLDGETLDVEVVYDQDDAGGIIELARQSDEGNYGYFGTAAGSNTKNSETNETLATQYTADAALLSTSNIDGALINKLPIGSGPIRGVWMHRGIGYCFRDSEDGTEAQMFKAGAHGWKRVGNLLRVDFDAGTGAEPPLGILIKDATTAAEAVLMHIELTSGAWSSDAAGYMLLRLPAFADGTALPPAYFANNNTLQSGNFVLGFTGIATVDGDSTVQSIAPSGRYEFRDANLFGSTESFRMYFVNGVDTAYEFNGVNNVLKAIPTGMVLDTPTHLAIHNYHLFLSFKGGSVQLSGDGDPFSWTVITGASEIAVGDEITGFNEEVGNSLFIFTRNKSFVLQGNTRANFDLDDFNINAGAHEWSLQRIGMGCFFDDRGFTTMLQTQRSGSVNFQENAQSALIQPLVEDLVRNSEVVCSHLIRNKNLYRCYFNDGRIVSIGFDGHQVNGHMPMELPLRASVACSQEDGQGAERILIGTQDGEVFELESGTSWDGEDIYGFIRTVLYHSKSPGRFKKYTHARIDGTFVGALTLGGRVEYDFDDPEWNLADDLVFDSDAAGGYWDDFVWDDFVWDRTTSGNRQVKIEGQGTNVSVYLQHRSQVDKSHTLRGVTLQWMPRRDDRRT